MEWIHLAQDRGKWWAVVNTAMKLCVPYSVDKFVTSLGTIYLLKKVLLHGLTRCVNCWLGRGW